MDVELVVLPPLYSSHQKDMAAVVDGPQSLCLVGAMHRMQMRKQIYSRSTGWPPHLDWTVIAWWSENVHGGGGNGNETVSEMGSQIGNGSDGNARRGMNDEDEMDLKGRVVSDRVHYVVVRARHDDAV